MNVAEKFMDAIDQQRDNQDAVARQDAIDSLRSAVYLWYCDQRWFRASSPAERNQALDDMTDRLSDVLFRGK